MKILGISSLLDEVLFTEGKEALGPEQGKKMERISLVILWLHISNRSALGETMNLALGAAPPGGGAVSDWCNITIQSPLRRGGDCFFFFLSFFQRIHSRRIVRLLLSLDSFETCRCLQRGRRCRGNPA